MNQPFKRVLSLFMGIMLAVSALPVQAAAEAAAGIAMPQSTIAKTAENAATTDSEAEGTAEPETADVSALAEEPERISEPMPVQEETVANAPTEVERLGATAPSGTLPIVYLSGSGSAVGNDTNDGETSATAVKTMKRALELVAPNGRIIMKSMVQLAKNTIYNWNGPVTVEREFDGNPLFNVGNMEDVQVSMNNITLDGKSDSTTFTGQVLRVSGNNPGAVVKFKDCIIRNANGGSGNGIIYLNTNTVPKDGVLEINNCTFDKCSARNGGAVQYYSAQSNTISDTTFTNCTANASGGAIYGNGNLTLDGCEFRGCRSATNSGGGVYFESNSTLTVKGGLFSDCYAFSRGGAIFMDITGTKLTVEKAADGTGTVFSGNSAKSYGGALYTGGVDLSDCKFQNNESIGFRGGAIETNGCEATFTKCEFTGNQAAAGGGAIDTNKSVGGSKLTITGCTLSGNSSSTGDGGAILMEYYSGSSAKPIVQIEDSTITGNSCGANKLGGGIGIKAGQSQLYVKGNVQITGNTDALGNDANVGNSNTTATTNDAKYNDFRVIVNGALGTDSKIGINTLYNLENLLCVTDDGTYKLTGADLKHFEHDAVSRDPNALLIVQSGDDFVLGGHSYQVQHWGSDFGNPTDYSQFTALAEKHVGLPGEIPADKYPNTVAPKDIYGFTYEKTEYSGQAPGNAIPDDNDMIVKLFYTRNNYTVKFVTEDANRGTLANANPQTIAYGGKPAAGVQTIPHDEDWFFTGWNYTMEGPDGTTSGTVYDFVYDYTDLTITGNVTLTATFAKQPFVSINTMRNGTVAIKNGTEPEEIPNGQTQDIYAWQLGTEPPYTGIGAFRANEHYHVSGISVVLPNAGKETSMNLSSDAAQPLEGGAGATATLYVNDDGTYGTVLLQGVEKAASIIVTFEEDPKYSITFKTNAGDDDEIYAAKEGLYKGDIYGAQPAGVPIRTGHQFLGWTTKQNANPEAVAPATPDRANYDPGKRMGTENITYYALWQSTVGKSYTYVVEIMLERADSTDASVADNYYLDNISTVEIYIGGQNIVVTEPHLNYTGFEYNVPKDASYPQSIDTGTVTNEPKLYLKLYYRRNRSDVIFHDNPTEVSETWASRVYGTPVGTETNPLRTPAQKIGYEFEGWYTDTHFVHVFKAGTAMPEANLNLYAKWVPLSYSVKYDTNGATSPAIMDQIRVHWGDNNLVPPIDPTRTGYTFTGWTLNGKPVDVSMTYEQLVRLAGGDMNTPSVTLLAGWEKNPDPPSPNPPSPNPPTPNPPVPAPTAVPAPVATATPNSGSSEDSGADFGTVAPAATAAVIKIPATGDEAPYALLLALMALAAAGSCGVFTLRHKRKGESKK